MKKFNKPVGIAVCILSLFLSQSAYSQTPDFNVQHLQDDVTNTGATNTGFISVASLNNAIALANNNRKTNAGGSGSGGNLEGDDLSGARQLTGTGTLTYYRESGSITANMRFNSSIWEYVGPAAGNNEMIVRGRYAINLNGTTNSVTQALTGIVNANNCIPFINGIMNNSTGDDADSGTALAYLENATTLRVQKGSNGNNVTVYITLVEFTGSNWTVLHGDSGNASADTGTLTLRDGSDGTGIATNVSAWSDAIIFSHHRGDTGASGANDAISDNWPVMDPGANNQTVDWTFDNGHDSAGTNRHFVHVLTNTGLNVTRYQNTANAANATTINITTAGLTDVNQALIVGSSRSSGGGTAYARGWRNYNLNSTTQAAHWSHRSGNTMSHEIQIVDLVGLNTPTSAPEINIQGNATTIVDGDITPLVGDNTDFGNVDITAGTNANIFTIQNTGTANLNLTGTGPTYIAVSGTHAGDFTVTANPTASIAASGNTTFTITFNPSAVGLRTATLTIANDDSDENPYNFDIQGTGFTTLQEINVQGNTIDIPDNDTTPITGDNSDFGNVDVTAGTQVNTFTIQNTGTVNNLNLTGTGPTYIAISGVHAGDFTVTANPITPITSSGSTTFNITFNPSAIGLRTATLTIANNDTDENPYNFDIQGTGTDACGGYITVFPYTEDFETGTGLWTQDAGDNFDWTRQTGTTPTGTTGPSAAASGSFYMFTEANANNSNTANFISPCFDLTGTVHPRITLFYHMHGSNTGTINVDLSTDSGLTYPTNIWTQTGEVQGNNNSSWNPISVDLGAYVGQTIKLRIQGIVGAGNNSDMAIDNISVTDKSTPIVGPGGVTAHLATWLKVTEGLSYTDGQSVNSWTDQGLGSDLRVHTVGQEPTYRDNATKNVNFNPVVEFDNPYATYTEDTDYSHDDSNSEFLIGDYGLYTQDMFVVLIPDDTPINNSFGFFDIFCGDENIEKDENDATGFGVGQYTARFSNEILCYAVGTTGSGNGYGVAEIGTGSSYTNIGILNARNNSGATQQELYYNANNVGTTQNDIPDFSNVNDSRFWLGRSEGWESSLNARVAEVITYSSRKGDANLTQERNRIQSYLGIKYGITLGVNGTSQDYVDSDGTVIWDQSANTGYNYDIAGVGRDDASELNQKQSSSVNNATDGTGLIEGILAIGLSDIYDTNNLNKSTNPTAFNNKEFLTWGNNGADLNLAASVINVDMSAGIAGLSTPVTFTSMQRIWKVVENGGDIPLTSVRIPQNAVRNITPPGSYLMFISDTPVFDPTADYRVLTANGANLETDYDFDGTKYITFGYAPQVIVERSIYFDGALDYVDMEDALDLNTTNFTVSAWIKRDTGTTNASIVSKRDATYTEGYDLRIDNSGYFEVAWNGGTVTLTSSVIIPENEWHQVSVIFNSGTATLYIDGVADTAASSLSAPIATTQSFYIAAAGKSTPTAHFAGNIDEVRVWDAALSVDQLRYVMNQEILDNTSFTNGDVIPATITKNDVATIPWTNLAGYYPMSVYTYTNTNDGSGNNNQGALRNLDTVDFQTAPLPYESQSNGDWGTGGTWLNNAVQTLPNALSIVDGVTPIDWNIVETNHNVTIDTYASLGRERSVLGLVVGSNELQVNGDTASGTGNGLTVTHYLKLDGTMDLEGESQLIQSTDSDLDVTSSGTLERDQQGTADLFTYNYWAAPVGISNTTTNNNSYTLPDVLNDGTNATTPGTISFLTSGYNGTSGSPIGIADYWVWKFSNQLDDDYASWQHVRSTGSLLPGEGYTMKGPTNTGGAISTEQNYVFNGKPHNGDINLTLSAGNDYLIGNPYASAIDANEFILDNISDSAGRAASNIINGTLYFWEHFASSTHNLAEYQGGYGTYTLMGGIRAISNDVRINATGALGTKTPQQFIPVGQGFFVVAGTGGSVSFKNSQRIFKTEASDPSVFSRSAKTATAQNNVDTREKIRLMFDSPKGYHRQLLAGVDKNATDKYDLGYDALLIEDNKEDLFWVANSSNYVIQAINNFNINQKLPLGVKINQAGLATIKIDELENLTNETNIYLHDIDLGVYHDLKTSDYEVNLAVGTHLERFEITFKNNVALGNSDNEITELDVHFSNAIESIIIKNPTLKQIDKIELTNILGQSVKTINNVPNTNYSEFKMENLSSGAYIIILNTENGIFSKKVLIE